MWADWENTPERHFYVDEVACTTAGQYMLPKRWITVDNKVCAEGHPVHFSKRVSSRQLFSIHTGSETVSRKKSTGLERLKLYGFQPMTYV